MARRLGCVGLGLGMLALVFSLAGENGFSQDSSAQGDVSQLVTRIDPAVVTIRRPDGNGSGFVIDEKGIVVTNYHVVEGATQATAVFPDKTSLPVMGFLCVSAGKDIALLKIEPGTRKLPALRLAEAKPSRGEKVYAFGAPLGLSGSVSDGMVAALRSGDDMRETLKTLSRGHEIYTEEMGYELDANWVQTTAPISPGNSGGPLVNGRGEVVGINTCGFPGGQNLNFAVCVMHIKQLMDNSSNELRPLSSLPRPREHRASSGDGLTAGDGKKTLDYWNKLSQARADFLEQSGAHSRKLKELSAELITMPAASSAGHRRPTNSRGNSQLSRLVVQISTTFENLAKAYSSYAIAIKRIDADGVDLKLATFAISEADFALRFGKAYNSMSANSVTTSAFDIYRTKRELQEYEQASTDLELARDVLRLILAKKYGLKFPSAESAVASERRDPESSSEDPPATVRERPRGRDREEDPPSADSGDETTTRERKANEALIGARVFLDSGDKDRAKEWLEKVVKKYPETKAAKEARALLAEHDPARAVADPAAKKPRTWTDRSGKFQIQAVFLALEDGKVLLRKCEDGAPLAIPLEKLSEADQRLVGQWQGPASK